MADLPSVLHLSKMRRPCPSFLLDQFGFASNHNLESVMSFSESLKRSSNIKELAVDSSSTAAQCHSFLYVTRCLLRCPQDSVTKVPNQNKIIEPQILMYPSSLGSLRTYLAVFQRIESKLLPTGGTCTRSTMAYAKQTRPRRYQRRHIEREERKQSRSNNSCGDATNLKGREGSDINANVSSESERQEP